MSELNIPMLVMTTIIVIVLIVFLIWRNRKDKDSINPDASNSVEETQMDQERREDSI
jgi:FtsZ-interacting cell division protein ZipA